MATAQALPTSPITYLKRELGFQISDWNTLTEQDKAELKEYAAEEMALRNQEDSSWK